MLLFEIILLVVSVSATSALSDLDDVLLNTNHALLRKHHPRHKRDAEAEPKANNMMNDQSRTSLSSPSDEGTGKSAAAMFPLGHGPPPPGLHPHPGHGTLFRGPPPGHSHPGHLLPGHPPLGHPPQPPLPHPVSPPLPPNPPHPVHASPVSPVRKSQSHNSGTAHVHSRGLGYDFNLDIGRGQLTHNRVHNGHQNIPSKFRSQPLDDVEYYYDDSDDGEALDDNRIITGYGRLDSNVRVHSHGDDLRRPHRGFNSIVTSHPAHFNSHPFGAHPSPSQFRTGFPSRARANLGPFDNHLRTGPSPTPFHSSVGIGPHENLNFPGHRFHGQPLHGGHLSHNHGNRLANSFHPQIHDVHPHLVHHGSRHVGIAPNSILHSQPFLRGPAFRGREGRGLIDNHGLLSSHQHLQGAHGFHGGTPSPNGQHVNRHPLYPGVLPFK